MLNIKQNILVDSEQEQKIIRVLTTLATNSLINSYALENAALGFIKPNETIPLEKYINDLELYSMQRYIDKSCIEGAFIDNNGKILNVNKSELIFEFFISNIIMIFNKVMRNKNENNDDKYNIPCKENLRKYFMNIYPLFNEIIETKVEYEFYDIIPDISDKIERNKNNVNIEKFIVSILLNGIKQGKCVDKYLKNVNFIPFTIRNLIKSKNKRNILINNASSLEYKIALFSVFHFLNVHNQKIFELKIKQWYKLKGYQKDYDLFQ